MRRSEIVDQRLDPILVEACCQLFLQHLRRDQPVAPMIGELNQLTHLVLDWSRLSQHTQSRTKPAASIRKHPGPRKRSKAPDDNGWQVVRRGGNSPKGGKVCVRAGRWKMRKRFRIDRLEDGMSWLHKRAKIDAEADRDGICAIGTRLGAEVFANAAEAQRSLAQVETDCQSIKAFRRSSQCRMVSSRNTSAVDSGSAASRVTPEPPSGHPDRHADQQRTNSDARRHARDRTHSSSVMSATRRNCIP